MTDLLAVLTAGGHALDVAAIASRCGYFTKFYDDNPELHHQRLRERDETLSAVVGHNNPLIRARIVREHDGARWVTLQDPDSIGWPQSMGVGCVIAPGVIITERVVLGEHVHVNVGATISQTTTIGDCATIAPGVNIAGQVTIGARTFIGVGAAIIDHINIGTDCVIGTGAVVINDIPDRTKVVGVPARALVAQ